MKKLAPAKKGQRGRLAATVALIAVVGLWGVRDFQHRRAVNALESRIYENADPIRVSASRCGGIPSNGTEW